MVDTTLAKVHELLTSRVAEFPELVAEDSTVLAERMVASIPVRHTYDTLVGPFYDTAGLRKWLGLTRQALASRVKAGSLLACPTADNQLVYPAWQFRADGSGIPHLPEVIKVLNRSAASPWTVATWLRASGGDSLGGLDTVAWLDQGGDPAPVLAEARGDADRWEH